MRPAVPGEPEPRRIDRRAAACLLATTVVVAASGHDLAGPVATANRACDTNRVEDEMRRRGVDPAEFPDPFRVSPAMQRAAGSFTGNGPALERLRRLHEYLLDEERFALTQDPRATLTAAESFETRRGNCVSFTTLFIALACSAGIPLRPGLKTIGEAERADNLILINDHVVAVREGSPDATVFDFNVSPASDWSGLRLISYLSLAAIHLNNRGVAALLDDRTAPAARYFEAATLLKPDFAEAWGNLGVVRRRSGDEDAAFEAYRRALDIDPGSPTVLGNLAALLESTGRSTEAFAALQAARPGELNAYTLIVYGDFELRDGHPRRALRRYRRAARKAPAIPEPWLAIARTEQIRGRTRAACAALGRALQLDPGHTPALKLLERLPHCPTAGARGRLAPATPARTDVRRGSAES